MNMSCDVDGTRIYLYHRREHVQTFIGVFYGRDVRLFGAEGIRLRFA